MSGDLLDVLIDNLAEASSVLDFARTDPDEEHSTEEISECKLEAEIAHWAVQVYRVDHSV